MNLHKIDDRGATRWIQLERSDKLNALSTELLRELQQALTAAENDDSVKVVVLTGVAGAFSVGYDIVEEVNAELDDVADWRQQLEFKVGVTMTLWQLQKPTIAAVDGWCLAGGCELAMACDMVVATDRSTFGEPEVRFGSGPPTLLMPFILGEKRTNELLFTGDTIDASAAERYGLINHTVPAAELESAVMNIAGRIEPTPLSTLRLTKVALTRAYEMMGLRHAINANLDIAAVLNSTRSDERTKFNSLVSSSGLGSALAWRDTRYGVGK